MRTSSPSRPRTKPPEERRDELMSAAERLFLKQGVGATTIDQITTTAKVAKGTFYLYFSSKDDVLAALGDRFAEQHLAKIKAAVDKAPEGFRSKLAKWAAAGVDTYLDSIRLHDILFFGGLPPTREGLVDNIVIDHLASMLQRGAEAGAWMVDDCRFTAVFLFSGLHAVVDDAYSKEKRVNRERLAQRVERLFFRAVGPQVGLLDTKRQ
jgi:AcrR family transcriptional regulator